MIKKLLPFLIDFGKRAISRQIKKRGGKFAWEAAAALQKEGDCPR